MNSLFQSVSSNVHPTHPRRIWQVLSKKASLGLVTFATIVVLLVARPGMTSADGCKTTTGDCSTSIGLYIS